MTKIAALAFVAAVLLIAPATAHGAPEPRAIDSRVLQDNTSQEDYGIADMLPNPVIPGGMDLLALDVREAYGPGYQPGVFVRLVSQIEAASGGYEVEVHFGPATMILTTDDLESWNGTGFDSISPGIPVGDGHPRAVDIFLSYASLGLQPGDTVAAASAVARVDGTDGDMMPGGYNTLLGPIILLADDSVEADYTLTGPAALIGLSGDGAVELPDRENATTVPIRLTNNASMDQFVRFTVVAPSGIDAFLPSDSVVLSDDRSLDLTIAPQASPRSGTITIIAESDLGALAAVQIPVDVPPAPRAPPSTPTTLGPSDDDDEEASPNLGGAALAMALIAAGVARRRIH